MKMKTKMKSLIRKDEAFLLSEIMAEPLFTTGCHQSLNSGWWHNAGK
jgi:hypothetical protein